MNFKFEMNGLLVAIIIIGFLSFGENDVYAIGNHHKDTKIRADKNGIYELSFADLSISIDANCGARIISFNLKGKEMLTTNKVHFENYGSTLWISPQKWKWPPSYVLDKGKYRTQINCDTLIFESEKDALSGFTFCKTFSVNKQDTAIVIRYEIKNSSDQAKKVAPWEVTRVHAGGISFFPKGSVGGFSKSNLHTEDIDGITWFHYKTELVDNHQKLFTDGSEGWLAHVNNGLLFIKQFKDIKPAAQAPNEAEIEIYANKDQTYIELENQGEYQLLKPGESLEWVVRWFLCEIPRKLDPKEIIKAYPSLVRLRLEQWRLPTGYWFVY